MKNWLDRLDSRSTTAAQWAACLGLIGLVGYALMTIGDVLLRWLFNSPLDGVADVSRLMVAVIIASFFPIALAERQHITIGFLGSFLGARGDAWLQAVAALVTSVFFVFLGWQFIVYTDELNASGETTWLLGLPVAPWWAGATFFMLCCIPIQVVVVLSQFKKAFRGDSANPSDVTGTGTD
jgi:TRAP-type C4-dicarboxylate transport system permease small subunit